MDMETQEQLQQELQEAKEEAAAVYKQLAALPSGPDDHEQRVALMQQLSQLQQQLAILYQQRRTQAAGMASDEEEQLMMEMKTAREQLVQLKQSVDAAPLGDDNPETIALLEQQLALQTQLTELLGQQQKLAAGRALKTGNAVQVTIGYMPWWYDTPVVSKTTFYSQVDFMEYLRAEGISALLQVNLDTKGSGEAADDDEASHVLPKAILDVADLVDGGVYTHAPATQQVLVRVLQELRHLHTAREQEMTAALLTHVQQQDPLEEYKLCDDNLRKELAITTSFQYERDVMIMGKTTGWVATLETHALGARPVKEVAARAKQLAQLSQHANFSSKLSIPRNIRAAVMVEKVEIAQERSFDAACKKYGVVRLKRQGRAISVVNSMRAARSNAQRCHSIAFTRPHLRQAAMSF